MRSFHPVSLISFGAAVSSALILAGLASVAPSCSSSSDDAAAIDETGVDDVGDTYVAPRDTAPRDTGVHADVDTGPIDPFAGCTRDPGAPSPDAGTDGGGSDTATDASDASDAIASDATAGDATAADAIVADALTDGSDASATDAIPTDTAGGGDPIGGADKFTLAMAMAGFPSGTGVLTAVITTERGQIVCQLDDKKAPISVANFIGLARGTRPAQRASTDWTYSKFYDGLLWHRVVDDFVIQGGDPEGTGGGGPGYDLPKENQIAEPEGTLAMAAATAPSGSQFYIVTGSGPAAAYNVFGTCTTDVAKTIKVRDHMKTIEIARCPSK